MLFPPTVHVHCPITCICDIDLTCELVRGDACTLCVKVVASLPKFLSEFTPLAKISLCLCVCTCISLYKQMHAVLPGGWTVVQNNLERNQCFFVPVDMLSLDGRPSCRCDGNAQYINAW